MLLQNHSSLQFFQSLLELLIKSENNSLLLLSANSSNDQLKKDNVFIKLLLIALNCPKKNKKMRKLLIGILKSLVKKWSPRKDHYDTINQQLTQAILNENTEGVLHALTVLRILSREDEEDDEVPNRFFFSPFVSGLVIPGPFNWELDKGYSLAMWIKLEDLQTLQRSQPNKYPVLFRLKTTQRTIEYYFSGLKLCLKTNLAKDIEIAILLTNTWYFLAISHSPSKELKVIINKEVKSMVAKYPNKGNDIEEIKICENFAGQLSSIIIYRSALSKEQLADIFNKLPKGICSPLAYKEIQNIPQSDIHSAFSPIAVNGVQVFDLHGEGFVGRLEGNAGVVSIPTPSFGSYQQISFKIILPVFLHLKNIKDLKLVQKLFFKWLVTMKAFGKYLSTYGKNTIKTIYEYKLLKSMLSLHIPSLPHELATAKVFNEIEEAIEQGKDAEKYIIEALFETHRYWNNTEVVTKFWTLLKLKVNVFSGKEYKIFQQLLVTMYKLSKNVKGMCCLQAAEATNRRKSSTLSNVIGKKGLLNEAYGCIVNFLYTLIENSNADTMINVVKDVLGVIVQREVCHCLYKELLAILSKAVNAHIECANKFDELNVYHRLIKGSEICSLETQIDCFLLLKKVREITRTDKASEESLYKLLCKISLKRSIIFDNTQLEERKHDITISDRKNSDNLPILENEHVDEEHSTSLLQEKVLSEQNSINNTIKKIKQIKIDIQETTKSNSKKHEELFNRAPDSKGRKNLFFEEFEISSTGNIEPRAFPQSTQGNHILSIEELVAQDPYKPPPAPKNEKMKQKRFFFGEEEEAKRKAIVPKLQIPSFPPKLKEEKAVRVEKEIKTFEQVIGKGKFNRVLEIDTETINKEFDIGGEKGKKLIDEDEEAKIFEQEIIELADHCLMAMARHSPSEEIVSKYSLEAKSFANYGPITASNKLIQIHGQKPIVFPQSTKERKQFTFCLDTIEVGAATPIKEESLITSKSSLGRDTIHLETEQSVSHSEVENLCLFLAYEMVGKKWMQGQSDDFSKTLNGCLKHEIVNLEAAYALLKLANKVQSLLISVISLLIKLFDESDHNKKLLSANKNILKKLLKIELGLYKMLATAKTNKVNKVVEFEQVIAFHSNLINESINTPNTILESTILQSIINSKERIIVNDCVKYLWGKALTEISNQDARNTQLDTKCLIETTLYILILADPLDKNNTNAPVVLYSDTELVKLLFTIIGRILWRTEDLKQVLSGTNSTNDFNINLINPFLNRLNKNAVMAISILTCRMLKNTKELTELEYWTNEAEHVLKYFLLILEANSIPQIEDPIMLLLGNLLCECCNSSIPEEHHQFYAKALAHIFKFLFTLIRLMDSKAKVFYEKYLGSKDGKQLVPVDEIYLMEGVTISDLMRILTLEYGQLLECNPEIVERNKRIHCQYIDSVRSEIIKVHTKGNIQKNTIFESNPITSLIESTIDLKEKWKMGMRLKKWNKLKYLKAEDKSKLSSHQFGNGLRGLLKGERVKENVEAWDKEYTEQLVKTLFNELPDKLKHKVVPPIPVEVLYNFNKLKGYLLIYKKHDPHLLLIIYENNKKLCKKWKLEDIKQLYRKDINGLEIVLTGGRSVLIFCESTETRNLLAKKLIRTRGKWCKRLNYIGTIDPIKAFRKSKLTEQWLSWSIPTLDYLLGINMDGGRSFNDYIKYPILPYEPSVFPEYTISPNTILHNTHTVYSHFSSFNSKTMKECALCKLSTKPLNAVAETYSIPFPLIENATKPCREHKKETVSIDDYYKYIVQLHEGLERIATAPNSIVTNWIDHNFGVYSESKLFKSLHPSRPAEHIKSLWDCTISPKVEVIANQLTKTLNIQHIIIDNISQFLLFNENGIVQSIKNIQRQPIISSFGKYITTQTTWIKSISIKPPIKFLHKQKIKYIVQGGFIAGYIQLTPFFAPDCPIISLNYHSSQITALEIDKNEHMGITGTKNGECIVFNIEEEMFWNPKFTLNDHGAEVTSISISNEAELFVTGGLDGVVNIYTLRSKPKLILTLIIRKEDSILPVYAVSWLIILGYDRN